MLQCAYLAFLAAAIFFSPQQEPLVKLRVYPVMVDMRDVREAIRECEGETLGNIEHNRDGKQISASRKSAYQI